MNIETGDLILFRGDACISKFLEYFGKSKYSHVGIIIKDPKFINQNLQDGLYVLHSIISSDIDSEEHKVFNGVKFQKLEDVKLLYPTHSIYIRNIKVERNEEFHEKLKKIHNDVYTKPYDCDMKDWIAALLNLNDPIPISDQYKNTNQFWCSALVSYVYVKLDWINDCNWSIIAPKEFSMENTGQIKFKCDISNEELFD